MSGMALTPYLVARDYPAFRKKVLEERQQCEGCGAKDNLCLHHRKPRDLYPGLIMDKKNVRVLCYSCHRKEHNKQHQLVYYWGRGLWGKHGCTEQLN